MSERIGVPLSDQGKVYRALRHHRWSYNRHACACGWSGKDHERHQAEHIAALMAEVRKEGAVIAAVLRDEATVEAVKASHLASCQCKSCRIALRTLDRIADRLGASQPREVAPGGDASTTVDPDATTTEGDL